MKGIISFWGHARFYKRVGKDFSKISYLLIQGVPFNFDEDFMKEFSNLKEKLILVPIVVALDWEFPFKLMCDTSDYVVRAVLG